MGDYRTTEGEPVPLTTAQKKRRIKRIAGACAGSAVIAGFLLTLVKVERKVDAGGYVTTTDYAEVRPENVGRVRKILVGSGCVVSEGDVLVQFEDSEEQAMLEQSMNRAESAKARIVHLESELKKDDLERERDLAIAKLRLDNASARLELSRKLNEKGLASGIAVEDRKLERELARVSLNALQKGIENPGLKQLEVLKEELEAAEDEIKLCRLKVAGRKLRAPISGRAVRHEFVKGEVVGPESVMYELFGGSDLVLKLRVDERFATLVHPGQNYRAQLVSYQSLRKVWFSGKIERVRSVIEAWGKRTSRTVYCAFDAGKYDVPPGTSAEAEIFVGKTPLWRILLGLN